MTLEAKGTIKLEDRGVGADGKAFSTFSVKAPTLGIDEDLPKSVTSSDAAVLALQEMIRNRVQEDFKRPIEITLGGESISCTYWIDPINNRTLDEFTREYTSDDDTKITITGPDGKSVETTPKRMALAAEVMKKSKETGIPPDEILAAAKKKAAKAGGAGE